MPPANDTDGNGASDDDASANVGTSGSDGVVDATADGAPSANPVTTASNGAAPASPRTWGGAQWGVAARVFDLAWLLGALVSGFVGGWVASWVFARHRRRAADQGVPTPESDGEGQGAENDAERSRGLDRDPAAPGAAPAPAKPDAVRDAVRKELKDNDRSDPTAGNAATDRRSLVPPPATPAWSLSHDDRQRLEEIARRFNAMPPAPAISEYTQVLGAFGALHDALLIGTAIQIQHSFSGSAPEVFLTAIALGRHRYAIVPSFQFVKDFPTSYYHAFTNFREVSAAFDTDSDQSMTLRCRYPGLIDESAWPPIFRKGRLSGFSTTQL